MQYTWKRVGPMFFRRIRAAPHGPRDGLLAAMRAEPLAPYGFRQSFGDAL